MNDWLMYARDSSVKPTRSLRTLRQDLVSLPQRVKTTLTTPGTLRGILLVLLAGACFSGMQAMVRHVSGALHPFEIAFFRNLFGFLSTLPLFLRVGFGSLRTQRLGLYALRGAINTVGMLISFTSLSLIPLAEATALRFTIPLWVTALAILWLGERLVWYRGLALLVGLIGTGVILQPGAEAISLGAGLSLVGAFFIAWSSILIKLLGRTESSVAITAYMGIFLTPLSLLAAVGVWQWPTLPQLLWMILLGSLGTCGQVSVSQAFKEADITALTPFDFSKLVWASLIGYFAFAEIPNLATWIGGAIIVGSSTAVVYAETHQRQRSRIKSMDPATDRVPERSEGSLGSQDPP